MTVPRLSSGGLAVFPATLVVVLFVLLPILAMWFGVDSRDHGSHAQW
jgi:hypothetical protein